MQDEDKFYGLIAQAEDIQKHAVALQRAAQEAVKELPEAIRAAVRGEARVIIAKATESASTALLDACNEAKASSATLRRTGLMQGVFLLAAALVLGCAGFFAGNLLLKNRISELGEVKAAIQAEESTLVELRAKTWGLELVNYGDGTRGIILPKGVKVDRAGAVQDGRVGIVIKP